MIAECKTRITEALAAAGIPEDHIYPSPQDSSKNKVEKRAWMEITVEDPTRNIKRVARFSAGGKSYYRWQLFERLVYVVVRIEDETLAGLDGCYAKFLAGLVGELLHDTDGNHIHITVGRCEWYEPEKVITDESGVAIEVRFAGGVFEDREVGLFTEVEVEPDPAT